MMHRYYGTIYGLIGCLILLCGFAVQVYAADSCLTQALLEETKVRVVFTDMTLDYQMQKGLIPAAIPEGYVNAEGTALVKDLEIMLPATKPEGNHKLKKPLEVQAPSGQRFRLRENTDFHYTLPETKAGYKVTIPGGTPLTKKEGTAPHGYALAGDITVKITPPGNSQSTLTIDARKVVDRIPGTSGMGTTLTIKPMRAPVGEYITLTVAKSEFDFSKARFHVCLRKQDTGDAGKEKGGNRTQPFIPSKDVELKELQPGEATLQVRIPDINESGPHGAKPVDLLVVARGPDGELVEALSREFAVSSRLWAVLLWIAAIAIPWLLAGILTARNQPKEWLRFDPIWFVSGKHGSASLSLAQVLL
jgi:hypothetical protein